MTRRSTGLDYCSFRLCRFFNAVGFSDSITLALEAVESNPALVAATLWIVDEYQDFNRAEDHLIRACSASASGLLIAGDDDQALYEELKDSHPEIIRGYNSDTTFVNAMLPFCGRCDHHIALGAANFIAKHRATDAIKKVYLPVEVNVDLPRIQVVACPRPTSAVDYIRLFISRRRQSPVPRRAGNSCDHPRRD